MDEGNRYESAKKKVKEIKAFYSHFMVYAIISVVLLVVNVLSSPGVYWFYWPMIGWGIGIFFHAMNTFNLGIMGKDWEERKIKEMIEKEHNSSDK
jgi:hypothetical protein